ncbi:MAG TPA: hypothetical protein VM056_02500 [Terriglobales bacterium]|nr:hypothetical protein [Terriglobales bacterium]
MLLSFAASAQTADIQVGPDKAVKISYGQTAQGSFKKYKNFGGGDLNYLEFEGTAGDIVTVTIDGDPMPNVSVVRQSGWGPKIVAENREKSGERYRRFSFELPTTSKRYWLSIYRGTKEPHTYTLRFEKSEALQASIAYVPGNSEETGVTTATKPTALTRAEPLVAADYFPKFPKVPNHPDLAEAPALLALYNEISAATWRPGQSQQAASGVIGNGKIKGSFFCEPGMSGPAEIKFTPAPTQPAGMQVTLVRVKDMGCAQSTQGLVVYGNGSFALGGMMLERGNLLPKPAADTPIVNGQVNGEATFGTQLADGRLKVAFFTDPIGNALRRMDETVPSSDQVARVRLIIPGVGHLDGETHNMVFQSQSAGTFYSLDGTFKTSSEIKAYPITADQLKSAEPVSVIFRFTAGQPAQRPPIALTLEGLTRIDTMQATDLGPAGTYLFHGRLKPGLLPLAEEVQPAPGTLAKYAEAAETCALKPVIPVSWLLWAPECKTKMDRVQAWSVDGRYRLTFTKLGKPVLEQFDPQVPGRPVAEWRAASFSADKVPAPKGPTEMWRNGRLAFKGPFKGLNPEGAGSCGMPGEDAARMEKCVFADGERVDAIYLARVEQTKMDASFAQRDADAEGERSAAAERRLQAAREAAEKKRQLAAAQQREKQQKGSGFMSALLGAAVVGMAADAGGGNALQAMFDHTTQQTLGTSLTTLASNPNQAMLDITNKAVQAKTGTTLTTMQNNPFQAAMEMNQKAENDRLAKASSPVSPSQASLSTAVPTQASAASTSKVLGDGTYGTPDGGYQIQVKYGNGTLTIVEPNKTSIYKLTRPNTYEFTNPTNGIKYGLRVIDGKTLDAFKPLANGGETSPTRLTMLRAAAPAPDAVAATPKVATATSGPMTPKGAKAGQCKARAIQWEGETRYVTDRLPGYDLVGVYKNKDNAHGHPLVDLQAGNLGIFEMHAAGGGGDPLRVRWWVVSNCDGTPFVLNQREGVTRYLLAFEYLESHKVKISTGFVEDKKVGQIDIGQLTIWDNERKMYIYGERVRSF